jgi:amino acid transporter
MPSRWRRIVFGAPLATHQSHHQRLPKFLALPVFSSDAISSVAYATEEVLLALTLGGGVAASLALQSVFPISAAIALLLVVVVFSYQQTIHAYPNGGGSYIVAKDNLGTIPGLIAAASLLIDYILTVAVSIAAGVAAIISAFPSLNGHQVGLSLLFIGILTVANLRGLKESGSVFMGPTYGFLVCIYVLLAIGFFRFFTGSLGHNPDAHSLQTAATGTGALSVFLILRAFSSGCVAMTGTEAVSNGVPAFKPPESVNAGKTLLIMAGILGSLFLGVSFLAWKYGALPAADGSETIISVLARGIVGRGVLYYALQITTCLLLIVAANTAYADFPRLTMLLAQDRFLPRQLANIGDRLVFSNGIIGLAVLSGLLIAAFGGVTHHLIPLYSVGVFLSFTLSQAGMVKHWFKTREHHWKRSAVINGIGACCTAVVLLVIASTKFFAGEPIHVFPVTTPLGLWAVMTAVAFVLLSMWHRHVARWFLISSVVLFGTYVVTARAHVLGQVDVHLGAWVVVVLIPILVWMFSRVHAHYTDVAERLTMERYRARTWVNTVLIPIGGLHRGIMPALDYARSIGDDVRAVYVEIDPQKTEDAQRRWARWVTDIPLVILESPYRSMTEPLLTYIDQVERERDDDIVTVIIPEFVTEKWWTTLLHGQNGLLLKWSLLFRKGVVVTNIRYHLDTYLTEDLGDHPLVAAEKVPAATESA